MKSTRWEQDSKGRREINSHAGQQRRAEGRVGASLLGGGEPLGAVVGQVELDGRARRHNTAWI